MNWEVEMAQWSRECTVLAEGPDSVPSPWAAHNCLQLQLQGSLVSAGSCSHMHTHTLITHTIHYTDRCTPYTDMYMHMHIHIHTAYTHRYILLTHIHIHAYAHTHIYYIHTHHTQTTPFPHTIIQPIQLLGTEQCAVSLVFWVCRCFPSQVQE